MWTAVGVAAPQRFSFLESSIVIASAVLSLSELLQSVSDFSEIKPATTQPWASCVRWNEPCLRHAIDA